MRDSFIERIITSAKRGNIWPGYNADKWDVGRRVGSSLESEMLNAAKFQRNLLHWYARHKRDLPWRRNRDPYRVWVSEIMLQQTRVSAVIPYYERFLARFPDVESLASAEEQQLLSAWAGLGYYSRARNMQTAAKTIVQGGGFPTEYETILQLPGIGPYTAAAIASIAFGRPHAALDGNVIRVMSRVWADPGDIGSVATRRRLQGAAENLLDCKRPGEYNQAIMELGATVCLPKRPECARCPVRDQCQARRAGRQLEFPMKAKRSASSFAAKQLIIVAGPSSEVLFWQRPTDSPRLAGFWELPEPGQVASVEVSEKIGQFKHTIVNTTYRFEVLRGSIKTVPEGFAFLSKILFNEVPLSTTAKKGLACLEKQG
jgi:A/G-specific adenine glycosylase